MKASKLIKTSCLAAMFTLGHLQAAMPQGFDSGDDLDSAPPAAEMQLLGDGGDGYRGEVIYAGQEFMAVFFISGRNSSTIINAQGDRFMDAAFPMAIGTSEDSIYRADLPLAQLLAIRDEWYVQAVLLTHRGEFWIGPIHSLQDYLAAQQQAEPGPADDIQYELAVTEGIPPLYHFTAEYEANSDDYDLEITSIQREADHTNIFLVLVTPGVGRGMHDVVEMHAVYANLGEDPGERICVYTASRTQDQDDEDLDYRLQEEIDT